MIGDESSSEVLSSPCFGVSARADPDVARDAPTSGDFDIGETLRFCEDERFGGAVDLDADVA